MRYPSIFSRLYETDEAFREMTASILNHGYSDREEVCKGAVVVSECLDILEALSMPDCRIKILPLSLNDLGVKADDPYSIYYKTVVEVDSRRLFDFESGETMGVLLQDHTVIGGLSPLTLVYSRPDLQSVGWGGVRGLLRRSHRFISFMETLATNGWLPNSLLEYVTACVKHLDDKGRNLLNEAKIPLEMLERLTDEDGREVRIGGFPIFREKQEHIVATSEYMIKSSKAYHGYNQSGMPLILGRHTIPNARYINGVIWKREYGFCGNTDSLDERILPGTGIRYPYLTGEDFFTEKIIVCEAYGGAISPLLLHETKKDGEWDEGIMLPLKQLFFDYFNLEDVKRLMTISRGEDSYVIELKIPVTDGVVELHKVYHRQDMVIVDLNCELNLAITPFMVGEGLPYHIFSYQDRCSAEIRFYKVDTNVEIESIKRLIDGYGNEKSRKLVFETTKDSWDYITIKIFGKEGGPAEGLIIPKFGTTNNKWVGGEHCFSIMVTDKAVSIVHSDPINHQQAPLSLDADKTVVAMATTPMFDHLMEETFISLKKNPNLIGMRIPTSVNCTSRADSISMLAGCNIAFDISAPHSSHWKRISNIFQRNRNFSGDEVAKCYCEEVAFLIRIAWLGKGLKNAPKIQIEEPLWMRGSKRIEYRNLWKEAFATIALPEGNIEFIPSRTARFSSMRSMLPMANNVILVDIDANHTILACEKPDWHCHEWEYKVYNFGINDLFDVRDCWIPRSQNGYVRCILEGMRSNEAIRRMADGERDNIDLIEYAIDLRDESCGDIERIGLPFLIFVYVLKGMIGRFAASVLPNKRYKVIFSGYGMKFLSMLGPFDQGLRDAFQNDENVEDVEEVNNFATYLGLRFDIHGIPEMRNIEEENICDGPKWQRNLATEIKVMVLENFKVLWSQLKVVVGNSRISDEGIMHMAEDSYKRCMYEFIERSGDVSSPELTMSDVEVWPYVYALSWLADSLKR